MKSSSATRDDDVQNEGEEDNECERFSMILGRPLPTSLATRTEPLTVERILLLLLLLLVEREDLWNHTA